jgi:hypothetical protein
MKLNINQAVINIMAIYRFACHTSFSLKARWIKTWLIWRLNYGKPKPIHRKIILDGYSLDKEEKQSAHARGRKYSTNDEYGKNENKEGKSREDGDTKDND